MTGKWVDAPITAKVIDFNVTIEHGLSPNPNSEESDDDDRAYDYSTQLNLITEVLSPKEHKGNTLNIELLGEPIGPLGRKYSSTLGDWKNFPPNPNSEDRYIIPSSIGYIERSRNKVMEGFIQLPMIVIGHTLTTLKLEKPMFIALEAEKHNGWRSVSRISIRHLSKKD